MFTSWSRVTPVVLILCLTILAPASPVTAKSSSLPNAIQYSSPLPDSRWNSPGTNIILRFKRDNPTSDPRRTAAITARGDRSGTHAGRTIIIRDGHTLVFEPHEPFLPEERVTATVTWGPAGVNRYHLTFEVGQPQPRRIDRTWRRFASEHGLALDGTSDAGPKPAGAQVTRPLPSGFPAPVVTNGDAPSDGLIFINSLGPFGPAMPGSYIMIVDNTGDPVFFRQRPAMALDFKVLPDGRLAFFDLATPGAVILGDTFEPADTCNCGNGYGTNLHDIEFTDDGNFLFICNEFVIMDMSMIVEGGQPDAEVEGMVFQEVTPDGIVVFQWRSVDYFDVTDAIGVDLTSDEIDYVHSNSIEDDRDGNIIVSNRHMSEVTKIDRTTGDIMWRLGGRNNQFTFINDISDTEGFHWQHDARRLPSGNITLFDNGNFHATRYSRAVEYQVDPQAHTATRVWDYRNTPDTFGGFMGSVQRLANGNTVIGWGGTNPTTTEVTANGTKVFEMTLPPGVFSYRAFRFDWNGAVAPRPVMWESSFDRATRTLTLGHDKFGDANVVEFEVYMGESPSPTTLLTTTGEKGVEVPDLVSGATYYFNVVAVGADNTHSDPSDDVVFTYENEPPDPVTLLAPGPDATLGTSEVTLTWSSGHDPDGDAVTYTLNLIEDGNLRSVSGLTDTAYVYTGRADRPVSELLWTVDVSDQEFSTASPDTSDVESSRVGFGVPSELIVHQNYPNPFNPQTTIRVDLDQSEAVRVSIYNVRGQVVRVLTDRVFSEGFWAVDWDGTDTSGQEVASGVYFYRVETPSISATRKMILVR